jgi:uncharacterized protein (DUF58 family)
MRPTRRGVVVAAVAFVAVAMAGLFGARALNALVAPALVGLGAGALQLALAKRPAADRIAPEPGFVGERRELTLRIEARRSALATVEDRVPDALRPERTRFETTTGTTLSYGIEPERRGRYEAGPLSVTVTDVLGLFVRRFRYAETTPVVVYPAVRPLSGPGRYELPALFEADRPRRREAGAFDHVREYERGDALRDVHWKASAKRPDGGLVVKGFAAGTDAGDVTLVATGEPRHADALASAAASVAVHLLDADIAVGLRVADGHVGPGAGREQRRALLELLARTDAGVVDDEGDALIEATDEGVVVSSAAGRTTFDRLVGDEEAAAG